MTRLARRFLLTPLHRAASLGLLIGLREGRLTVQAVPDDPRAIVKEATSASDQRRTARPKADWTGRLTRDSLDRAARLGLATLARMAYDYPTAEPLYRQLIAERSDRYALYAHFGLAEGYELRGYAKLAREQYDRALAAARTLHDQTAEAEAHLALTFVRGRNEGVAVAEALIDTAKRLGPPNDPWFQSSIHSRLAITQAIRGKPVEALSEAKEAIALAHRGGETAREATSYRVLGQVLQYRGKWDSAFRALQRSESLYVKANRRSELANSMIWHAQVLGSVGWYGQMRDVMRRALVEGQAAHNPSAMGDAERAFGVLNSMFANWPAAASHFKRSRAIALETGDSSSAKLAEKYLARVAIVAGDLSTARQLTTAYYQYGRRSGDPVALYESQQTLADVAAFEGDWAAADSALEGARKQLSVLPGDKYRTYLAHQEARQAAKRGDLPRAARLFEDYLGGKAGPVGPVFQFDAQTRLAEIRARQGRVAEAERLLTAATELIERWRSQLGESALRTQAFQTAATVDAASADPAAAATAMGRVLAAMVGANRTDAAFALAERWRARDLIDRMNRAIALRESGAESSSPAPPTVRVRTTAEVVSGLPRGVAVIEFVAQPNAPAMAFVAQPRGVRGIVLPATDSLGALIDRFGALVEGGVDPGALARRLAAMVIDPIAAVLEPNITRLVISADGPFYHLPFEALKLADGQYLVQRFALGMAPSASLAADWWARPAERPAGPTRILALGNPTAAPPLGNQGTGRSLRDAGQETGPALPPLPGAAREARLVSAYAPLADLRVGREASAEFLRHADLRPYRVLHFAAHAQVDDRSLDGSRLILAGSGPRGGSLAPGDLATLRLNADLVVLSACNTAGGRLTRGEGIQGLTSAFLQAGARAVVATGWRIADARVVPFVDHFYAAMAEGQPVIDALRTAKLRAIADGVPPSAWAAFAAIGDPLVVVPLSPAKPRSWFTKLVDAVRSSN